MVKRIYDRKNGIDDWENGFDDRKNGFTIGKMELTIVKTDLPIVNEVYSLVFDNNRLENAIYRRQFFRYTEQLFA